MKKNMNTLIIVAIAGAVVFTGLWWFLSQGAKEQYPNEGAINYIGPHTITVNSDSYLKIFNYAHPRGLPISETTDMMIAGWPGKQSIVWRPQDINSPRVIISLIKRVSTDPDTYDLVRVLASSTPNIGGYTWTIRPNEVSPDTYIEVGCVFSDSECHSLPITITI